MAKENSVTLILPKQIEKPVPKVVKEVYEGSLGGERAFFGSKLVQKAISFGGAGLLSMSPVAAAEVDLNPKNAVVIQGEMPSQNALENLGITETGDNKYETLTVGNKGPKVTELKWRMFEMGYYETDKFNDSFTANTVDKVKKFEEINGLPVDGIADPEMQALFFSDSAKRADGALVVATKDDSKIEESPTVPVTETKHEETSAVTTEVTQMSKEILPGSEEERIIDARFKSFLEGEGEFSDESLKGKMYYSYIKDDKSDLGFCGVTRNGQILVVQGLFLGHFELGNDNFVAMGVKNSQRERKIVLVDWPINKIIEVYNSVAVLSSKKTKNSDINVINEYKTENELFSFLDSELLNRVVLFNFYNLDSSILNKDYDKKILDYISEYVLPRRDINNSFVSGLLKTGDPYKFNLRGELFSGFLEINHCEEVSSYFDVKNQGINNFCVFPLIDSIQYRIVK